MSEKTCLYIKFCVITMQIVEEADYALVRLRAHSSRDAEKFKNQQKQHPRIAGPFSACT